MSLGGKIVLSWEETEKKRGWELRTEREYISMGFKCKHKKLTFLHGIKKESTLGWNCKHGLTIVKILPDSFPLEGTVCQRCSKLFSCIAGCWTSLQMSLTLSSSVTRICFILTCFSFCIFIKRSSRVKRKKSLSLMAAATVYKESYSDCRFFISCWLDI